MPRLVIRPKWNQHMGKCGFPVKLSQALSFWVRCIDPKNPRRGQAPRRASAVGKRLDKSTCDLDRLEPPGWQKKIITKVPPTHQIHVESDELMRLRYICIDRQATIRRKSSTIHLDVRYEIQIASISLFHDTWSKSTEAQNTMTSASQMHWAAVVQASWNLWWEKKGAKMSQAIISNLKISILGFWTSVKQISWSCSWLLSLAASSSFSTDTREPMVSPYGLICRLEQESKKRYRSASFEANSLKLCRPT